MQKTILKRTVVSQEKQRYNVVSRKNAKTLTFLHSKKGFSSVATSEPEQLMVLLACAVGRGSRCVCFPHSETHNVNESLLTKQSEMMSVKT